MSTVTEQVKDIASKFPNQYTRREVAEKIGAKYKTVRNAILDHNLGSAFVDSSAKNANGIIGAEGTLKGEIDMKEPTKADMSRLRQICEERSLPFDKWGIWWDKTKDSSIAFYNKEAAEADNKARDEFLKRVKQSAPQTQKQPVPTKNLAVFANFDVHIGKHCELIRTGNEYTPQKAVQQVLEGQESLYNLVKLHNVSDVLLPMGNDIVHVDNNKNTSTSGTPQDTYGSLESQMLLAAELYIRSIEWLAKKHNVWLCHVHSNHDRVAGWSVSQIVTAYFHDHPRVHAAADSMSQQHRKYFVFGNSLLMFHHGEAKEERLLGVIKSEANAAMAQTNRIYCYQGHTHHKTLTKRGLNTDVGVEKDHSALTVIKSGNGAVNQLHVETVRSPSPPDDWHSRSLYCNIPSIEVFVLNDKYQFGRFTYEF